MKVTVSLCVSRDGERFHPLDQHLFVVELDDATGDVPPADQKRILEWLCEDARQRWMVRT